jgi:hypothetical protein
MAQIDDPQELARLVLEGSPSRVRQAAAQRIEDPAALRLLLKQVRDKDKSVYKIIKHKCDVLRAAEQRIAQRESAAAAACASLERHAHRIYDAVYVATFEHFEARWREVAAEAAPELTARAAESIAGCREIIAAHARLLAQQAEEKAQQAALRAAREDALARAAEEAVRRNETLAEATEAAAAARAAEEQARAEKQAAEDAALRQLSGLIARTHAALREGNTGRAAGLRRAIEAKLPALAVPPHLARQLQQLNEKLEELKEWKNYAVAPKRAELIEDMESLIGSSEAPQALADRIKHLQEEWKTISKGIVVSESEADWQRFHQASVSAYAPCREYFEAQAKLRQDNLAKRRDVLERLLAFETAQAGDAPDWRGIAAVLREAPLEWRRHFPVDRAARLALQKEFDACLRRLEERLDAWHAGNAAEKKLLIERASQLLNQDDGREAVDAVKRLQLQWKDVGPADREQERRLWEEFRGQCDAVFQKRQQAHTDYVAGLETRKAQAVALCRAAEDIAGLTGAALLEGADKIPEWRAAFDALGELPRAEQRSLHDRFERALQAARAAVSQQRARDAEQSFTRLLEAARCINAYGWAVAEGAEHEALRLAAEASMAAGPWPKGGAQALKDAWLAAESARNAPRPGEARPGEARPDAASARRPDVAARETAQRLLCIRSELLTDAVTPPEDQALRRQYQVQRLVQHMGQGTAAGSNELDALVLEWVRGGPLPPTVYEPLLARFAHCRGRARRT